MMLKQKHIYILLSFLVFVYIVLRAIYVPMVFDEIYTFFHYVRPANLTPFNDYTAANNHLINTNLTYLSYNLFGNYPLALRLPNVLSFLVFSYFLYKIGEEYITNIIPRWAFYISLLVSINFIAFFSLSRGYGLSFAFMIGSIYFLIKSFKQNKSKIVFFSVLFMMLALFANFSLLVFILISLLILLINVIKKRRVYFNKKSIFFTGFSSGLSLIVLSYVLKTLFIYKEQGILYWGDLEGFWISTVNTLYHLILQIKEGSTLVDIFVILFTVVIVIFLFIKGFFKKENVFSFLFIGNVLGILALAYILKINYPKERIALHLFPLFIGAYCFAVNKISKKTIQLALVIPLLVFPVISAIHLNLSYVSCWEEDNLPLNFLKEVQKLEKNTKNKQALSIYADGVAGYCWAYELDKNNIKLPTVVESRGIKEKRNYDYVIETRNDIKELRDLYDSITYNKYSNYILLKRKQKVKRELLFESQPIKKTQINGKEYTELIRTKIDSLGATSLFVEFEIKLESNIPSFQHWAIASVDNIKTGENLVYKRIKMDWKKEWTKKDVLKQGIYLNNLPKKEKLQVVVYLWNIKKQKYNLLYAKSNVYKVLENYTK